MNHSRTHSFIDQNSKYSSRYGSVEKLDQSCSLKRDQRMLQSMRVEAEKQQVQENSNSMVIQDMQRKVRDLAIEVNELTTLSNNLLDNNKLLKDKLSQIEKINQHQLKNPSRQSVHILALEQDNQKIIKELQEQKKKLEQNQELVYHIETGRLQQEVNQLKKEVAQNQQKIKDAPENQLRVEDVEVHYYNSLSEIRERVKEIENQNQTLEQQEDAYQESLLLQEQYAQKSKTSELSPSKMSDNSNTVKVNSQYYQGGKIQMNSIKEEKNENSNANQTETDGTPMGVGIGSQLMKRKEPKMKLALQDVTKSVPKSQFTHIQGQLASSSRKDTPNQNSSRSPITIENQGDALKKKYFATSDAVILDK